MPGGFVIRSEHVNLAETARICLFPCPSDWQKFCPSLGLRFLQEVWRDACFWFKSEPILAGNERAPAGCLPRRMVDFLSKVAREHLKGGLLCSLSYGIVSSP